MTRITILFAGVLLAVICSSTLCNAQCSAPEAVAGADRYDELLCQGVAAEKTNNEERALELFLAASRQPLSESPNVLLFGRIAKAYALVGKFHDAKVYLDYDNIAVLWQIGIVRCQSQPSSEGEYLVQDGKLLEGDEARHMTNVVCGEVFDNDADFTNRDALSFAPAAKAILQYATLRREIENMQKRASDKGPNSEKSGGQQ